MPSVVKLITFSRNALTDLIESLTTDLIESLTEVCIHHISSPLSIKIITSLLLILFVWDLVFIKEENGVSAILLQFFTDFLIVQLVDYQHSGLATQIVF